MSKQDDLKEKNNSDLFKSFCVYQKDPGQLSKQELYSLVWFNRGVHPNTPLTLDWTIDYNLAWTETGVLAPGISSNIMDSGAFDQKTIIPNKKKND